jgi:Ca2+-binding EF-hand superfamily protein
MVEKDSRFDRSKFTSKVKEYTKGSKKEEELNMLFDMLDVTKDGYLYTDDFRFDPISNDRISRSS